ncbi:neuropeptide-like 1 [Belonocnema kinseyi]|uniref:neuropeptide-like 1 n=1 Tax=Belonocnema kinseyi TaxID=2817044 RepID=UPI00143CDAEF|nr:neuropeptide-like 1 [Belonocnema kinseyi]
MPEPTKRHIGALARLGWLPSLRSARFSRSPRYLVARSHSADGTSSNNPANTAPWALRSRLGPRTRYLQSLYGGCRHGIKRFPLLPRVDKFRHHKFPIGPDYVYN